MRMSRIRLGTTALAVTLAAAFVATSLAAAPPPQNKTYFTIVVGLESPHSWTADCVRFTAGRMCAFGGFCGAWQRTEPSAPETAISFVILNGATGETLFDGQGRVDARGRKSSLSGVGRFRTDPITFNFSFTGRAVKPRKCARLVREWQGGTAATGGASR